MYDEAAARLREQRRAAERAECFARLVLAERRDTAGRKLLDYAERTVERVRTEPEKTITWLSTSLWAQGVDDSALTGLGFEHQQVRHATVVHPLESGPATAYAARLAAYN
ncbi:MAG: hypothetical protein F4X11_22855 [Acidobacteria bacterium]|nr:hypothetical protein [Acidobacteriota bacterium]